MRRALPPRDRPGTRGGPAGGARSSPETRRDGSGAGACSGDPRPPAAGAACPELVLFTGPAGGLALEDPDVGRGEDYLEEPAEARLMALFYRPITIATALARRRL